jgi:hypothetical protein
MTGGQLIKATRRYGVPLLAAAFMYLGQEKKRDKIKGLVLLILIPLLSMGYGQNSKLFSWLKKDWLVRLAYGLLVSIPFWFFGGWYASIALPLAYSIRDKWLPLPSFKVYKDYDFLWEDFFRFLTLGVLITLTIEGGF